MFSPQLLDLRHILQCHHRHTALNFYRSPSQHHFLSGMSSMSLVTDNLPELTREWERLLKSAPLRVVAMRPARSQHLRGHRSSECCRVEVLRICFLQCLRFDILPASVILEREIRFAASTASLRELIEAGLIQRLRDCMAGRCTTSEKRETFFANGTPKTGFRE